MKDVTIMNTVEEPETQEEKETQTRTYVLANPTARKNINLKKYEKKIIDIVHECLPDSVVTVSEQSYTVQGITRGAAIKIGKKLSKNFRSDAFLISYSLFISSEGSRFNAPFTAPSV